MTPLVLAAVLLGFGLVLGELTAGLPVGARMLVLVLVTVALPIVGFLALAWWSVLQRQRRGPPRGRTYL